MNETTEIGKIERASFGYGGYEDLMIGFSVVLSGENWGVSDFIGTWAIRPVHTEWTKRDQDRHFAEAVRKLHSVLKDAKVKSVQDLVGIPIKAKFVNRTLSDWCVLTDVL